MLNVKWCASATVCERAVKQQKVRAAGVDRPHEPAWQNVCQTPTINFRANLDFLANLIHDLFSMGNKSCRQFNCRGPTLFETTGERHLAQRLDDELALRPDGGDARLHGGDAGRGEGGADDLRRQAVQVVGRLHVVHAGNDRRVPHRDPAPHPGLRRKNAGAPRIISAGAQTNHDFLAFFFMIFVSHKKNCASF